MVSAGYFFNERRMNQNLGNCRLNFRPILNAQSSKCDGMVGIGIKDRQHIHFSAHGF